MTSAGDLTSSGPLQKGRGPDASEEFMIKTGLRRVSFGMTSAELEFEDTPPISIDSN